MEPAAVPFAEGDPEPLSRRDGADPESETPSRSGLPLIQPETATGEAAELLARTQRALGITPNLAKAMANSPAALKGFLDLFTALRGGSLPAPMRECIALLVAQENGSDYLLSQHTYIGTKVLGLTEAEAAGARRGRSDDPRTAAALALALALVRYHGVITDEELAAARHGGLSDGQIAEVVAHVALSVFTNYLAQAARVAIDWPLVRHDDRPLPRHDHPGDGRESDEPGRGQAPDAAPAVTSVRSEPSDRCHPNRLSRP